MSYMKEKSIENDNFEIEKVELIDDGSLDTVIAYGTTVIRYSQDTTAPYRDQDGKLDFNAFLDNYRDDILDAIPPHPKQQHPWRKRQRKES